MMESRPNCYECKYRGSVPGDTHSCCRYPGNKAGLLDFFEEMNICNMLKLRISANEHGIRNGWFFWPCNFDPIWLIRCDGYTPKEDGA